MGSGRRLRSKRRGGAKTVGKSRSAGGGGAGEVQGISGGTACTEGVGWHACSIQTPGTFGWVLGGTGWVCVVGGWGARACPPVQELAQLGDDLGVGLALKGLALLHLQAGREGREVCCKVSGCSMGQELLRLAAACCRRAAGQWLAQPYPLHSTHQCCKRLMHVAAPNATPRAASPGTP